MSIYDKMFCGFPTKSMLDLKREQNANLLNLKGVFFLIRNQCILDYILIIFKWRHLWSTPTCELQNNDKEKYFCVHLISISKAEKQ